MKKLIAAYSLAVLAFLASTASMAAVVNVAASNPLPVVGQQFTMTLSGNVPNAFAATIAMSFNPTTVAYVSGIGLGAFTVFVKSDAPATTPTVINIEIPSGSVSGQQNYAQLTFKALAAGPAGIVFSDDGGTASGWPDFYTSNVIPVSYINANVIVQPIPVPAAAWLFGSALGAMGWMRRKAAS